MKLSQHLQQKQTMSLKQYLSPQLIQLFRTFQMSYSDLYQEAESVVQDNPLLELKADRLTSGPAQSRSAAPGEDISSFEESIGDNRSTTLTETLMTQLELQYLDQKLHSIVERLIEYLDDKGYLKDYAVVRDKLCYDFNISPRKVSEALKILQSFEPEGVGARSLKECLILQLHQSELESVDLLETIEKVIRNHLDDLGDQQYDKIGEVLGMDHDGVEAIHAFIKQTLHPNPAHEFSRGIERQLITPSYEVALDRNTRPSKLILTNLEETSGFQVSLSSQYEQLLNDPNIDEESRTFLTQKAQDAQAFIDLINKRHENLNRLAEFIIYKQENYIRYGPHYLEPLSQKEVADYLAVSRSTVSRILSSKYIRTPHGVVLFKTLCPRNHFGKTAERLRFLIQDLIDRYPSLSDEGLKEKLNAIGIPIARRTVAKYRQEMGMGSSYTR